MSAGPFPPIVYDAGALVAAERGDRRLRTLHDQALLARTTILVPAPVVAQAWRNGAKQARLSRLLDGCTITPTDEEVAKAAGVLLCASRTSDVVDAIVVVTALPLGALVFTSDADDLNKLAHAANAELELVPV
ncbi:MAG TPA: PIN domain-containing protein [Actinophytocola sp.]|uniref:PIN domain-containing protein n=1 Tax=Actinophytocola sp. TaxID=1872138 RepID=UPI002E001CDC|nr:PIN domain-containing protein [Actinophytocola sp.]